MNEIDFYKLRVCWEEFFIGISEINLDRILHDGNKNEWEKLRNSFTYLNGRNYTQHDIFTESMANLLHTYMGILNSSFLVREMEKSCPGWPWLLMVVDKQVAKRKGTHYEGGVEQVGGHVHTKRGRTDVRMLLEQLNPGHI